MFLSNISNKIIRSLGRKDYTIDNSISFNNLTIVYFEKFGQLFRGFFLKLFLKEAKGIIFRGKRCQIKHKNLIRVGKTLLLGDNVEINALSREGIVIGNNVSILRNTIIECTGVLNNLGEGLSIGNNVGIAQNCFIQVRGKVTIGNNVIFAPGVSLFSENHNFSDPNKYINEQGVTRKGITIKDGVWIASGATILDGVTLSENCIVAAGSVVNKDVPPFTIVGGIPAKVIKNRNQ